MAHHVFLRIARVYLRLEYNYSLTGKRCPFDAANQLLGFAREHGAAHYFYSSLATLLAY